MNKEQVTATSPVEKKLKHLLKLRDEFDAKRINVVGKLERLEELVNRPSAIKVPSRWNKLSKKYNVTKNELKSIDQLQEAISFELSNLERLRIRSSAWCKMSRAIEQKRNPPR